MARHSIELTDDELTKLSGDELLQLGIDLYNGGYYFEAHEAWETVWLDTPNEMRAFYQGLIQVTAAFVHVTRNEYPGAVSLLITGIAKLEAYPADTLSLDVAPFIEGARAALAQIKELGEKRLREFRVPLVPRLHQLGDRVEGEALRELEARHGLLD